MLANRARVNGIRERARQLFDGGATGVQVAAAISEAVDAFLVELVDEVVGELSPADRSAAAEASAVVAVGGSGRGEMAPYSDADLMFLFGNGRAAQVFPTCAAQVVRDCWDAGLKLGHSIRTPGDAVALARQDPQIATALLESRLLWGSKEFFEQFRRRFRKRVVTSRHAAFLDACVAARAQERGQHAATAQELVPDVKRSHGGLRDVHLIRWLGYACYGTTDIDSLRLQGAIDKEDARKLVAAHEFLMRIRVDLHFSAGRAQDVLTRQEQLRIATERGIEPAAGQRPVERFMQDYFRHTTAVADVAQRFIKMHRPSPVLQRLRRYATTRRLDGVFRLGPEAIDVVARHRSEVCEDLEQVLRLYRAAAAFQVDVAPTTEDCIRSYFSRLRGPADRSKTGDAVPREWMPDGAIPASCCKLFLEILGFSGRVGPVLRSMYDTGVLEWLIPDMAHARCLLQFNEYHSYTVDEHTLRAIEEVEGLASDPGPLRTALANVRRKEILRLAVLLHDLGKGYEGDHSDVGREIAERIAQRLRLDDHDRATLVFLVHRHLVMAHLAFRRNFDDPKILVPFSREVGSPETLDMLYVLTAADLKAVGPDVWSQWKGDLLAELYDRAMIALSGKHYEHNEAERMAGIRDAVRAIWTAARPDGRPPRDDPWLDQQLQELPAHYLSATAPMRIAADLQIVRGLAPRDVAVEGNWNPETRTVEYRIIAHHELAEGCFHKIAGVLTAKRLEILSAQISTSADGTVIDSFRVIDDDYPGEVPRERIDDIRRTIQRVLTGAAAVPQLFRQHTRFASRRGGASLSGLPTRVVLDNDSSDRCTIIDVFAHDRPGLLYTITKALYELGLSVLLAKIATHTDQVVDVFYVTDLQERKLLHDEQLDHVRAELLARLEAFENQEHLEFVS